MHHAEHSQWNSPGGRAFCEASSLATTGLRASARSPRERYVRRTVLRFLMANYVIAAMGPEMSGEWNGRSDDRVKTCP